MAKASVHVTKSTTKTHTTVKVGKSRNKSGGNPNRCPVCGKFTSKGGSKGMNKEQREVRKRLKGINTVKQFEEMLDSVLISEEERRILNLIYKEQKPFSIVADEIGISERTLTRKHAKLLMKIGSMF